MAALYKNLKPQIMKSIYFKAVVFTVILSAIGQTLSAKTVNETSDNKIYPGLTNQLTEAIGFPRFINSYSEINLVKAMVQVDSSVQIQLLEMNASNTQLKKYVEEQLSHIHMKEAEATAPFLLTLKFQL